MLRTFTEMLLQVDALCCPNARCSDPFLCSHLRRGFVSPTQSLGEIHHPGYVKTHKGKGTTGKGVRFVKLGRTCVEECCGSELMGQNTAATRNKSGAFSRAYDEWLYQWTRLWIIRIAGRRSAFRSAVRLSWSARRPWNRPCRSLPFRTSPGH